MTRELLLLSASKFSRNYFPWCTKSILLFASFLVIISWIIGSSFNKNSVAPRSPGHFNLIFEKNKLFYCTMNLRKNFLLYLSIDVHCPNPVIQKQTQMMIQAFSVSSFPKIYQISCQYINMNPNTTPIS
jgi:hypothetical protein